MTDDARLVLAVLRDAAGAGAQVASRLGVLDVIWEGGQIEGVVAASEVSGDRVEIRADAVVNATGPRVERLAHLEEEAAADRLHPSKGVHVVAHASRFPVRNLVIMNTPDKRSAFVLPRGDTVAIGTTDTSYHGDQLLWPEIERADVEYLLDPLKSYFDVEPLGLHDVVAAWSGVRPLVAQKGKDAAEISRKEEVWVGTGGMITIAGGKLTGFRTMATTVLDFVAERLGRSLGPSPRYLAPLGVRPVARAADVAGCGGGALVCPTGGRAGTSGCSATTPRGSSTSRRTWTPSPSRWRSRPTACSSSIPASSCWAPPWSG